MGAFGRWDGDLGGIDAVAAMPRDPRLDAALNRIYGHPDPDPIVVEIVEPPPKPKRMNNAAKRDAASFSKETKEARFLEEKGKCQWCKKKIVGPWHAHHIVPVAKGGTCDPSNLMVLHPECHNNPLIYEILHDGMQMPSAFNASPWRINRAWHASICDCTTLVADELPDSDAFRRAYRDALEGRFLEVGPEVVTLDRDGLHRGPSFLQGLPGPPSHMEVAFLGASEPPTLASLPQAFLDASAEIAKGNKPFPRHPGSPQALPEK